MTAPAIVRCIIPNDRYNSKRGVRTGNRGAGFAKAPGIPQIGRGGMTAAWWRTPHVPCVHRMERFPRGGSLLLDRFAQLLHVSTTVAAIMIAVIVLQLATQVFALVDLARRRAVRGGRKWVWAVA